MIRRWGIESEDTVRPTSAQTRGIGERDEGMSYDSQANRQRARVAPTEVIGYGANFAEPFASPGFARPAAHQQRRDPNDRVTQWGSGHSQLVH